ncbi:hypothetical protein J3R82DRAFT_3536 [Butyriboletus roseoflavus]|nr:hypothetical protein J3R82DRAFT_3536 [Butyriboletus roseoflavus]
MIPAPINLRAKLKHLNLTTYKYHVLADYPDTIRRYGTTDSYTTQLGELEHRKLKWRYPRSGKKRVSMVSSIARQEAIERSIWKLNDARQELASACDKTPKRHMRISPSEHHHIAESSRTSDSLIAWLAERRDDPAFDVDYFNFISKLQ